MPFGPHVARTLGFLGLLSLLATAEVLAQTPPSEQVLPANAVAWVRAPNLPQTRARAPRTQFGRFVSQPGLNAFVQAMEQRILDRWAGGALGFRLEELLAIPSGEAAFAVTRTERGRSVMNALFDVSGQEANAEAWLERLRGRLVAEKAEHKRWAFGEITLHQFVLPESPEAAVEQRFGLAPPKQLWYFLRDGLLVFCTDQTTAVWMLRNWGVPQGKLAQSESFVQVRGRLGRMGQGNGQPHDLEVVFDPFGYFATQRADFPRNRRQRMEEVDLTEVLRQEGFDAIRAIGVTLDFTTGDWDSHAKFAVFAPVLPADRGVRVLSFPNGPHSPPPGWLPSGLTGVYRLHWARDRVYAGFGDLFDAILQEPGAFEDVVTSIEDDPNGPGLNFHRDLVALLSGEALVVSAIQQPVGLTSRQTLLAIETTDPALLAKNIAAAVANDPNVRTRQFQGHTVWEFFDDPKRRQRGNQGQPMPPWLATVAHGHLLVATQQDVLHQALSTEPNQQPFEQRTPRFKTTRGQLSELVRQPGFFQGYWSIRDSLWVTYELTQLGQLREEQTLGAYLFRELVGADGQAMRPLPGNLLPPFATVAQELGTGGVRAVTEPGFGWVGEMIILAPTNR